jgi:hypothetical protein
LRPAVFAIAITGVAACAASGPAPSVAPQVTETAAAEIPVRVRWNVISDRDGRLVVDAVVERRARLGFPVSVTVDIPKGLALASGPSRFEIPDDGQTGESVTRLEFTYAGRPPAQDLRLVGDGGQTGVGVHATDSYRFGRSVEAVKPAPSGPNIRVGDKDLGPAIPIHK